MWQPLLLSAGCIPALILLAAVFIDRWRRKRRGERQPLSEKLLRPAGYSLQRKLEDLNDSFNGWFAGAFVFSALAVIFSSIASADATARIIYLMVFGLTAAVCTILAWRTLLNIRNYRRGLLGEQAMAEYLQPLLAQGYKVFHDITGSGKWNIDHVAIRPPPVSLPSKPNIAPKSPAETARGTTRRRLTAAGLNLRPAITMPGRRDKPGTMRVGWKRNCPKPPANA